MDDFMIMSKHFTFEIFGFSEKYRKILFQKKESEIKQKCSTE